MYKKQKRRISKGERAVIKTLKLHKIIFESEKTFTDCRSPKNRCLRFDFYLPNYNLLIEYQGHHHYKPINKYKRAKTIHEKTKVHDGIKRQYANKNNINLLTIHYRDLENVEQIITTFLLEGINYG